MIEEIFFIANLICALGTILQVKDVLKNRVMLKGYSFIGSLLTFLAVLLFQIGFLLCGQYLSVAVGLITLVYWLLVVIYVGLHYKS
ncbi:MAG: hypothetical protein ACTSRS_22885 [Candidatus Helarchaeota archaeon]